jgi:hypothetical protein
MTSPHQDFDRLKSLLRCKRYEQPPPAYFHSFSDKVIARLEADELVEYSSWWQWLVGKFDAKPVLACVYGMVVSGLLLAGFKLSEAFQNEVAAMPVLGGPWFAVTPGSPVLLPSQFGQSMFIDSATPGSPLTLNPVFKSELSGTLFNGTGLSLQPVNFSPSSH